MNYYLFKLDTIYENEQLNTDHVCIDKLINDLNQRYEIFIVKKNINRNKTLKFRKYKKSRFHLTLSKLKIIIHYIFNIL